MKVLNSFWFGRAALSALFITAPVAAWAQTPLGTAFTYQGQLKQSGQPFNGNADMVFRLYDAQTGGGLLGTQTINSVPVANGLFTVQLNGSGEFGPAAFSGAARWLEIEVNGTPLTPRQALTAAPYALFSAGPWQTSGSDVFFNAGNVGIGTDVPSNRLHVRTSSGTAIYGLQTAATGATYGVWGQSSSLSGTGVFGSAPAASSAVNSGVYGSSASTAGRGVFGIASAVSGTPYGVRGEAQAPNGAGVYGINNGTSGSAVGVYGLSNAPSGTGVSGRGNYSGVNAQVFGTSGAGVLGFSSPAAGTTYGVWGFATDSADYGVYCTGRFAATGTKSFRLDHPLDPQNRYLHHYCAEGPEPLNVYSGTVTTDAGGEAWVTLPDYFEAINRDFRYGLTVVDDADSLEFVQAKVAREIRDNRFKIRTSAPHIKVSWEVKAVRNDLWVRAYGAPVEIEKPEQERGTYQHPELYGQPAEKGVNYHAEHERPSPALPEGPADEMERSPAPLPDREASESGAPGREE